jgi:hypothetical protein
LKGDNTMPVEKTGPSTREKEITKLAIEVLDKGLMGLPEVGVFLTSLADKSFWWFRDRDKHCGCDQACPCNGNCIPKTGK